MSILEVKNLQKIYPSKFSASEVEALHDINFSIDEGEFTAIMGESGSGKTTLLNILACLDQPTLGQVLIQGNDVSNIPDSALASFRRSHLGFVFQDYNLLESFSNKDNILMPLVLNQEKYGHMKARLEQVAGLLNISHLLDQFPYEISGGQKQRIAIARALISRPDILLADEPTGALDSKNSLVLLELFEQLNKNGQTIVMVTHSIKAASFAGRVLFIKDGVIFHQLYRGRQTREEFFENISDTLTIMVGNRYE